MWSSFSSSLRPHADIFLLQQMPMSGYFPPDLKGYKAIKEFS